jgi:hypothetical protein
VPEQVALAEIDLEGEQDAGLRLALDALREEPAARLGREMAHADDHRLTPRSTGALLATNPTPLCGALP